MTQRSTEEENETIEKLHNILTTPVKKQMNIRDIPNETKTRFDVLNATEQHKTQADTLKFLLDEYDNNKKKE